MNELNNSTTREPNTTPNRTVEKRPDESSGLLIEAKFKISDPESGEVIAEGRA